MTYNCSRCKGIVPNPRYASGIACHMCGKQVWEDPSKSQRIYRKAYICQECGAIVFNHKYLHDHSCEGCKPDSCNVCGDYLAWNPTIDYKQCINEECGQRYTLDDKPVPKPYK